MGATPKTLRQPPPRRFENYTLSRVTSANVGLVNIPDSMMTEIIPGNTDDLSTSLLNIGFDFQLDNIVYRRFIANSNGWMILAGPTETSVGTIQTSLLLSSSFSNEGINLTNVSQNVLLCPWFDDLRTVASDVLNPPVAFGTEKTRRIVEGLETPPITFNPTEYGVKMFNDVRSPSGRRLVVRWTCLSDYTAASTIIKFEALLYENGTIEFRYVPRKGLTLAETTSGGFFVEDATVGIFMPGTNRFRDFSPGLGYNDGARQRYIYGGNAFVAGFLDTGMETFSGNHIVSRPYTWRLRPASHWPGLDDAGSMFVFAPPVNRRRVLPRALNRANDSALKLPTVARTGDTRKGNFTINFDDRKTLIYVNAGLSGSVMTGTLVNYPTTLQRFYGDSEPGVVARQDLFTGDFEFTASLVKGVSDNFIDASPPQYIEPWSEDKIFDNAPDALIDAFFSGSSIDLLGDGLSQPLRSKTQIKFSLPVSYATSMVSTLGVTSSIYYYNRRANTWEIPQNSTYTLANGASLPPAGTTRGDLARGNIDSPNQRIIEDVRGFGPLGNVVASGSHNKSGLGDQTDASINSAYSVENTVIALSRQYNKSIQVNESYRATADEVFRLPVNQPFLIEKAIIEVPLALGDGWFRDKTTCMQPLETTTGSFDIGGPGITVALFNQYVLGNVTRRDLIMTGTITHFDDNTSDIVFSNFPGIDTTFQIRQIGFKAFGGLPAAVVTPVTSSTGLLQFTGSVPTRMTAMVSNGIIARFTRLMNVSNVQTNRSGVLDLFNTPEITLGDQLAPNFIQRTKIAYINNFGRGATGFDPSGRSVFGKEFATSQAISVRGKIDNPFYLSEGQGGIVSGNMDSIMARIGHSQFALAIASGSNFTCQAALPLESHQPSPYMVYPNDTLVLAIAKHRPVFYSSTNNAPFYTSGSIAHDVKLMSGAINITLYGSLLRENKEFHDTLNQPLASDAIHEIVIGNEPVLDQFESDYRELYTSGSYDDFVAGTLLTKTIASDGRVVFTRGERSRIFSKNDARSAPVAGTSAADANSSVSFRLQPYYERSGDPRHLRIQAPTERFWDSVMPSISDALSIDGNDIWIPAEDTTTARGLHPGGKFVASGSVGWAIFNFHDAGLDTITNFGWQMGYPFEPRYAAASRQQQFSKSLIAKRTYSFADGVTAIAPTPVNGLLIMSHKWTIPSLVNLMKTTEGGDLYIACDMITSSLGVVTGALSSDDAVKYLYGYGDQNTISLSDGGQGANHFPEMRVTASLGSGIFDRKIYYTFGPIIRGWKYGVYSGLPAYSAAYFRPGRFGQFRDMLEQRLFSKFLQTSENASGVDNFKRGTSPGVVTVKFVDAAGKSTRPENTWAQNLSFEATSSVPYFDGETRNRTEIVTDVLNTNIISLKANRFGQVTL